MKRRATGLLAVVGAVFVATFALPDETWVGYLRAAAEAGLVGGLADWFAVTALFRRPLGLPIPHTALVPTRKDALASTLGAFVTDHFLTADTVRGTGALVVPRVAEALLRPGVAERLAAEAVTAVGAVLDAVGDEAVADAVLQVVRHDLDRRDWPGLAGRLLEVATAQDAQRPVLDLVLPYVRDALVAERPVLRVKLKAFAESQSWVAFLFVTDRRVDGWLDQVERLLTEMVEDPRHPLRREVDAWLGRVAGDLQHDPVLRARVDALLREQTSGPLVRTWLTTAVGGLLQSARESTGSVLTTRLVTAVRDLARRAVVDGDLRARLERRVDQVALHAVTTYAGEFTGVVERTIKGWSGADASRKIELAAGRDLQYIRINGTVVGALAGLVLHAVAELLG